MKKRTIAAMLALSVFGLAACDDEDPVGVIDDTDEIVGTWISQGDDVAPGFTPFATDSIIAIFDEDDTYEVRQYYGGSAQPVELSGTYTMGDQDEGDIRGITLTQTNPQSLTAQGIFQVSGSTMQYEVLDVSQGTPPTVEGGFGSSVVGGQQTGDTWIQNYVRVSDD